MVSSKFDPRPVKDKVHQGEWPRWTPCFIQGTHLFLPVTSNRFVQDFDIPVIGTIVVRNGMAEELKIINIQNDKRVDNHGQT